MTACTSCVAMTPEQFEIALKQSGKLSTVAVREVSITDYIDRAAALAREHWQETEASLSSEGPALVVEVYDALNKAGNVIAFAAFDGDDIIGYSVAILGPHLHYGFTYAHHDLLYVRPDHRRGRLGLKLIRATENAAKERGARFMTWHAKPGSAFESIIRLTGYAHEETVYRKEF